MPYFPKVVRVLVVEADENDFANLQGMLRQVKNRQYKLTWVNTVSDAENLMTTQMFDVALIDYDLQGVELIKQVPQELSFFPRILLSTVEDNQADELALSSGASDYLIKSKLSVRLLERAIRYSVAHQMVLRTRAENEQRKALMFATMAHDLKTPIRAEYRVLSQVLQGQYGELSEQMQVMIQELIKSNRFKHHIVDNLMTSFQSPSDQEYSMTPGALHPIIHRLIDYELEPLITEKKHTIVLKLDDNMPDFLFDAFEMERVLRNIIQNAVYYTQCQGIIRIHTCFLPDAQQVMIDVIDNGPGIPEDIQSTVFEPYQSGSKKFKHIGSGLGLYLSKRIVEDHQGQLTHLPAPDGGVHFQILLPCNVGQSAGMQTATSASAS